MSRTGVLRVKGKDVISGFRRGKKAMDTQEPLRFTVESVVKERREGWRGGRRTILVKDPLH